MYHYVALDVKMNQRIVMNLRWHHVIQELINPRFLQRKLVRSLLNHRLQVTGVLLHHLQQVVHQILAPKSMC